MTVAVRVRAKVTGHRRHGADEHELALALPPGPATAGQIIEAAVAAEVGTYQARAAEASLVRVLTEKSLLDDLGQGAVRMGGAYGSGVLAIEIFLELLHQDVRLFNTLFRHLNSNASQYVSTEHHGLTHRVEKYGYSLRLEPHSHELRNPLVV